MDLAKMKKSPNLNTKLSQVLANTIIDLVIVMAEIWGNFELGWSDLFIYVESTSPSLHSGFIQIPVLL